MSFLAPILQPVHAYDLVLPLLTGSVKHERGEAAAFVYCDGAGRLRGMRQVRSSLRDAVDLSLRQIVKDAIDCDAELVVMAHNHPSGESWPSRADRDATRRIATALHAIGIRLHDHLIVAGRQQWSFRAEGLL
ncbi:JAB domain-containing protein [Sphingomonas turrisvirgatae]|nr:JAB domain-containing protein [Sphingomonas turrisvirgatae]